MAKTAAEKQRDYRVRRSARMAELTAENAVLRAENEGLREALDAAEGASCKHPSGAVVNGTCRACGQDAW